LSRSLKRRLAAPLVRAAAVAVAIIGVTLGSLAVAGPAQAHNSNYHCIMGWVGDGITLTCSGGSSGDTAQGRLKCQRFSGEIVTRYTGVLTPNGTTSVSCSSGYYAYERAYRKNFADGHTTNWIIPPG
jgi:hypothetical protein